MHNNLKNIKVKIITLYCGENEFDKCVEMVSSQICSFNYEQVFIKNKGNLEAHSDLYQMIMDELYGFDYFVKLDADMVLKDENSLERLLDMVISSGSDIFSIPVHDYMTDSMIWGLNVYRSGVKWHLGTENLFTDQQHLDGEYHITKKNLLVNESLVSHAIMPSSFQAFAFGVHRAAKIIQVESEVPLLGHAFGQYKTLKNMYFNYISNSNDTLGFALIGAYLMVTRKLSRFDMLDKNSFLEDYKKINYDADLNRALIFFKLFNKPALISVIGYPRFFLGFLSYVKRKLNLWS